MATYRGAWNPGAPAQANLGWMGGGPCLSFSLVLAAPSFAPCGPRPAAASSLTAYLKAPSERALDGAHPLHAQPLQAHPVSSSPGGIRAASVAAPKQPMDPAPAHEEVDAMTSFSRPRAAPVEAAQTVAVEREVQDSLRRVLLRTPPIGTVWWCSSLVAALGPSFQPKRLRSPVPWVFPLKSSHPSTVST